MMKEIYSICRHARRDGEMLILILILIFMLKTDLDEMFINTMSTEFTLSRLKDHA